MTFPLVVVFVEIKTNLKAPKNVQFPFALPWGFSAQNCSVSKSDMYNVDFCNNAYLEA